MRLTMSRLSKRLELRQRFQLQRLCGCCQRPEWMATPLFLTQLSSQLDTAEFRHLFGIDRTSSVFWTKVRFTTPVSNLAAAPAEFRIFGEHYWKREVRQRSELTISLPVHDADVVFEVADFAKHRQFEGPWRFIDIAQVLAQYLSNSGEDIDSVLS